MDTVKLGIIGLGFIGQLHLKHALRTANTQVVAVADNSTRALEAAKALGIKKLYTNYEELLVNKEVDAVVISLPTHLHLNCTRQAAEAKKDIFLEKPIAVTVEEAKSIIAETQKNGVKLMVGYPLRFNRSFMKVKEDIENGLLGDVVNTHAIYVGSGPFFHRADGHSPMPVPDWWFNKQLTGGGVLVDLGVHLINLLRWWFGEIVDIKGMFGHRFRMDFEDSAICLARFTSGTLAIVNVGWFSQEYLLRLDLLGTVKHVSVSHMPPPTMSALYQMLTKGMSSFNQPHFDELQHFIDCLREDKEPLSTAQDGLRDLETIAKAYNNQLTL